MPQASLSGPTIPSHMPTARAEGSRVPRSGLLSGAHHFTADEVYACSAGRDYSSYKSTIVNNITIPVASPIISRSTSSGTRPSGSSTLAVSNDPYQSVLQGTAEEQVSTAARVRVVSKKRGIFNWRTLSRFLRSKKVARHEQRQDPEDIAGDNSSPSVGIFVEEDPAKLSFIEHYDKLSPVQALTTSEVYVRSLLSSGRGLPCWEPRQLNISSVGGQGIIPGDVGTYTAGDGFQKAFNLWDDTAALQATARIFNMTTYSPPPRKTVYHAGILKAGDTIVAGASQSTRWSTVNGRGCVSSFEFRCQSTQGAVLAITSSADLEKATITTAVRDCVASNAQLFYRCANATLGLEYEESLYIITGCIKSDSWALAAYKEPMKEPQDILRLLKVPADTGYHDADYNWTDRGTSEARSSDRTVGGLKDQSLFLRGFTLSFSPEFRIQMKQGDQKSSDCDGSFPGRDYSSTSGDRSFDGEGGHGRRSEGGDGSHYGNEGQSFGGYTAFSRAINEGRVPLHMFPGNTAEAYQPCEVINKYMLEESGALFALSHDDDWKHQAREPEWEVSRSHIIQTLTKSRGSRLWQVENGVVFLALSQRLYRYMCSDDAVVRPIVFMDGTVADPIVNTLSASFYVDLLCFPTWPGWRPGSPPTNFRLPIPLGPPRRGMEEEWCKQTHQFFLLDLPPLQVQSSATTTIILYDASEPGLRDALLTPDNRSRRSVTNRPVDPAFAILAIIWHSCRAWDATLETRFQSSRPILSNRSSTQYVRMGNFGEPELVPIEHPPAEKSLEMWLEQLPLIKRTLTSDWLEYARPDAAPARATLDHEITALRIEMTRIAQHLRRYKKDDAPSCPLELESSLHQSAGPQASCAMRDVRKKHSEPGSSTLQSPKANSYRSELPGVQTKIAAKETISSSNSLAVSARRHCTLRRINHVDFPRSQPLNLLTEMLTAELSNPTEESMKHLQVKPQCGASAEKQYQASRNNLEGLLNNTQRLSISTDLTGQIEFHSRYPETTGKHGDVYRGSWLGKEEVAVCRPRISPATVGVQQRFIDEVELWRTFEHPNVVPVYGVICIGMHIYSVSPWMECGTSISFVKMYPRTDISKLLLGISDGLAYLHSREVVHGNLRGANVLISNDGAPRLSDFGLHEIFETCDVNPRWVSPEVICQKPVSKESDIWSLGMTYLELLTRRQPYDNIEQDLNVLEEVIKYRIPRRPRDAVVSSLNTDMWALLKQCWRQPEQRPSIRELKDSLTKIKSQGEGTSVDKDMTMSGQNTTPKSQTTTTTPDKAASQSSSSSSTYSEATLVGTEDGYSITSRSPTFLSGTTACSAQQSHSSESTRFKLLQEALSSGEPVVFVDGAGSVVAGTLQGLIWKLVDNIDLEAHEGFRVAFFIACSDLIDMYYLFETLRYQFDDSEQDTSRHPQDKTTLQHNILKVFCYWLSSQLIRVENRLLDPMKTFCEAAMRRKVSPTMWKGLGELLDMIQQRRGRDVIKSLPSPRQGVMQGKEITPRKLAVALTLLEGDKYKAILPCDYLSHLCGRPGVGTVADAAMTNNKIIQWTKQSLLHFDGSQQRASVLKFYIYTAQELRKLRNYQSLVALAIALGSAKDSVVAKGYLSDKTMALYEWLLQLTDPEDNHYRYRNALEEVLDPVYAHFCIPWLALHLKELDNVLRANKELVLVVKGRPVVNLRRYSLFSEKVRGTISYPPDLEKSRHEGGYAYLEDKLRNIRE